MTSEQQATTGVLAHASTLLKISESVLSSATIALTGLALGTCVCYGVAAILGGAESWWSAIIAIIIIRFMVPIMIKATSEEGLQELKRNRAFELALLVVMIVRDSLSIIVLFRLVLYAAVLFSDKGVSEGWPPLRDILRQVILG